MEYLILICLFYFLVISIMVFIKTIPFGYYLTKGKILQWNKEKRGIYYFPEIEYKEKDGNTKITELKQYSAGWIRPRGISYLIIMINKQGEVYLFSDKGLKPLISLSFIILLYILIVNSLKELFAALPSI